ncbi:MAG: DUF6580 family putative transport protein [Terriglobia bacterium]
MVVYLYVLGAILFRILPHPWNATPLAAMFLFSGALFKRKSVSLLVPLAALLVSDYAVDLLIYHGAFPWFSPITWIGFLMIGMLGWTLRGKLAGKFNWLRIGGASVVGSTLFFLFTNFGWMWWTKLSMYPHTMMGLTECYAAGIPFYMNDLIGDLAWNAVMFGSYYWLTRRSRHSRISASTAEAN